MSSRSNVLSAYKNMLRLARCLSEPKRTSSIVEIRQQFRANKEIPSHEIEKLLVKANSSLGYLKIISPRGRVSAAGNQTGVTKIVFGTTGSVVKKAVSNWTGSNMDPDSVKRHQSILKRAGFKNNSDAKGFF